MGKGLLHLLLRKTSFASSVQCFLVGQSFLIARGAINRLDRLIERIVVINPHAPQPSYLVEMNGGTGEKRWMCGVVPAPAGCRRYGDGGGGGGGAAAVSC